MADRDKIQSDRILLCRKKGRTSWKDAQPELNSEQKTSRKTKQSISVQSSKLKQNP